MVKQAKQILVMGVSGSGKSTVGEMLARNLGIEFIEADEYHSMVNIKKMSMGIGLSDMDRVGWLKKIKYCLLSSVERNESFVLACSALKASYREGLAEACPNLKIVWLQVGESLATFRVSNRKGHFVSASLIKSQYNDLHPPNNAINIDASESLEEIIKKIKSELYFV